MSGGTESPRAGEPPVVMAEVVTWGDRRARIAPEQPPVRWRELLAVVLLVVLADVTLYRAYGLGIQGVRRFSYHVRHRSKSS